jgi:Rieske Fe-S protein
MDRRAFVKGCVGAAVGASALAAGFSMAKPLANVSGATAKVVSYVAAKKVGGPAPRGVGIIPLEAEASGQVLGLPTIAGVNNLEWYKYCGHNGAPGLQESYSGDNVLRYFITPDKIAQGFNPWYKDLVGKPVNVANFKEPGFGAAFNWRSEGASGSDIITGIIINVGKDLKNMAGLGRELAFEKVDSKFQQAITEQVTKTGLLAFSSFCPHFCCVPGWKEAEALAKSKNAWDIMFCTCHFSQYDPFIITTNKFLLEQEEAKK